jgi:E3 ubiquitin-protein ligase UBR7
VVGEKAREGNKYNQNFEGKFCGCGREYDPEKEKGTMFQCLGLGHLEDGGCGEDWWHPECLLGLPRVKHDTKANGHTNGSLETVKEETNESVTEPTTNGTTTEEHQHVEDPPLPSGFPDEDDFDHMICYKCVNAFPWIKAYAGSPGFLTAGNTHQINGHTSEGANESEQSSSDTRKRKAEDDLEDSQGSKKAKADDETAEPSVSVSAAEDAQGTEAPQTSLDTIPKHATFPPAPAGDVTLFLKEDFRDHLCRCPDCFPRLAPHSQLLEEEEPYEPPLSETDGANSEAGGPGSVAGQSVNSGSLLDRGEAALSSMDRVRAIEGVMAYNHVKDKVKAFLQPFAESGQPVGAEEIRAYFAKLRGDEMAEREAMIRAEQGGSGGGGYRRGQEGY